MKISNPAALLFDFDGVLVESFLLHRETWKESYRALFNKSMKDYPRGVTSGLSPKKIALFLATEAGEPDKGEALLKEKYRLVLEGGNYPPLFDGVKELFEKIKTQDIPFAIVSNAKREYVQDVVEYYTLPVSMIFGLDDFSKPKPDKEPYEKAAQHLGIDPNQFSNVYVFEDSMPGIQSAIAAGMIPVGVLSRHTKKEMLEANVSHSINGVSELQIL